LIIELGGIEKVEMMFPAILFAIVIILSVSKLIDPYEAFLWGFLALALIEIYIEIKEIKARLEAE
jgi:hypothetical protein